MTAPDLQDGDHVVRYVAPRFIHDDNSVDSAAFRLRGNENGLSAHWLEYFGNMTKEQQLQEVRRLTRLTVRRNGRFAELNVGATQASLHRLDVHLSFVRNPLPADAQYPPDGSHTEIIGLPPGDSPNAELAGDLIAECVQALHPAPAP